MVKKIYVPLLCLVMLLAGVAAVSAQDWVRLGEKDVDFHVDHDTIKAEGKGHIREIRLRVMYNPIKFKKVVINYKDGEKKELEYLENVQVGQDSTSITIDGDGHAIKSVDFWYETDSAGGKKSKVTVYGRS